MSSTRSIMGAALGWFQIPVSATEDEKKLLFLESGHERIAGTKNVSQAILEAYYNMEYDEHALYVASNPNTSQSFLEERFKNETKRQKRLYLIKGILENPSASCGFLSKIAQDCNSKDNFIKILNHQNTNKTLADTIITKLMDCDRGAYRTDVAQSRFLDEQNALVLAADTSEMVKYALLHNPRTPQAAIDLLATDINSLFRERAAKHAKISEEKLFELCLDDDATVRNTARKYVKVSAAQHDKEYTEFCDVLRQIRVYEVDQNKYFNLSQDDRYRIRECVAQYFVPASIEDFEVIENLAFDPDYRVRMAVTQNPNTPFVVMAELAKDSHYCVRADVARHICPREVSEQEIQKTLSVLAKDSCPHVVAAICENPFSDNETLLTIANNENQPDFVNEALVKNTTASDKVLDACLTKVATRGGGKDRLDWILRALYTHSGTLSSNIIQKAESVAHNNSIKLVYGK